MLKVGNRIQVPNLMHTLIKFTVSGMDLSQGFKRVRVVYWKSSSTNDTPTADELNIQTTQPLSKQEKTFTDNTDIHLSSLDPNSIYLFDVYGVIDQGQGTREVICRPEATAKGQGRANGKRMWNKTHIWKEGRGKIDARMRERIWDRFFNSNHEHQQLFAYCLVSKERKRLAYKPSDADGVDSMKHAGHIIADSHGGPTCEVNLIPEAGEDNMSHGGMNLIDYMVQHQPTHLHELACRLQLAYSNVAPSAVSALDFLWQVYHEGAGLEDDWVRSL